MPIFVHFQYFCYLSTSVTLPSLSLNLYPITVLNFILLSFLGVCRCLFSPIIVLVAHSVNSSDLQPDAVCVLPAAGRLEYIPHNSALYKLRLT